MVWIAVGGAIGAISRYILGVFISKRVKTTIPLSTILINILGSLGLGVVVAFYLSDYTLNPLSSPYFLFLAAGFLGAFTTFSTFSVEAIQLWQTKAFWTAMLYILLSMGLSILSFFIGSSLTASYF